MKTFANTGARRSALWLSLAIAAAFGPEVAAQSTPQPITASGLRAPGSITYDAEGVPVIVAANDYDAAYLLGYAHAQNRFWQMDFNRRGASGTAAELVGPAALASDVQIRTLGLRRAALRTWQAMTDDQRGWLKSYADGVNLWLSTHPLPPEYGALELTKAEPWSPVDSVVIGKALAFQLSFDLDIDFTQRLGTYAQVGQAAGFNGQALFFEDTHRVQPPDNRISIQGFQPSVNRAGFAAMAKADVTVDAGLVALTRTYRDRVKDHPLIGPSLRRREDRGASNWWVISGQRSFNGKALLANDPHLGLDTPATFMEVHVVSSESKNGASMNVVGASAPGTPAVTIGCNERVCWGLTTNPLDVTDTYQEQLVLNTYGLPTHTIYKGVQEPVRLELQSFYANQLDGTPDNPRRDNSIGYLNGAATILVPRRNNGPIVQISGNTGLSVQYTGWGPTFELEALRQVNRAQNLDQFKTALTYFDVGSQNFAYADVDGNIAYFSTAEMPIRADLQAGAVAGRPPYLVRDGSGAVDNEWLPAVNRQTNQAVPYEILRPTEMPSVVNPAQGYIANANNDPVGTTLDNNPFNQVRPGGGIYYLNAGYSSYRMGRIDRLIQEKLTNGASSVEERDVRFWQSNTSLLDAELVLPYLSATEAGLLAAAKPEYDALLAQTKDALETLRAWDNMCGFEQPFSTPTGIKEGYDLGDDPANLPNPTNCQIGRSVAATLWATWRGQATRNIIDATLTRAGIPAAALPDATEAYDSLKYLLDSWGTRRGVGASGLNFFQVSGAATPENARDFLLLKSLKDALDLLASEAFAPAFNRSTDLADYRWGRLHRITFDHPLGGPFNLPNADGTYGFSNLSAQLPGVPRGGGYEAVDASSHSARANTVNGFTFGSGAARRFVGEMSSPIVAKQILPGGQSGVVGNPLYASQLSRWLTNRYKPLNIPVATAVANPASVTNFVPQS